MPTLTIPRETLKSDELIAVPKEDYREFSAWKNNIKVNFDEQWFWTPEWQKKEAEADNAIRRGKTSKSFSNHRELISSLKTSKKR